MHKNYRPLIGVTPNYEKIEEFRKDDCYISRINYIDALHQFDATSVLLTYGNLEHIKYLTEILDGIVFTGGDYDLNPALYGEKITSKDLVLNESRGDFEIMLFKEFVKTGKPILGICAGHQLMNVVCGGSLFQSINLEVPGAVNHKREKEIKSLCHKVKIEKDTLLYEITKKDLIEVNTNHRQAVKKPGENIIVSGICPDDGVVEAIELKGHKFCLGIEWHPEHQLSDSDSSIFASFVKACR